MDTLVISLQKTIDFLPDGVLIVDRHSQIVLANKQSGVLFGYPPDALVGSSLMQLIPPRFRAAHPGQVTAFFHNPSVRSMGKASALVGLRLDETEFDVDIALSPVVLNDQQLVVAVIRDMTAHMNMERMLQWRNEQLEAINVELERFGFTISHDLKSPLVNIHAIVHLLSRELSAEKKEEFKEHIQHLNHTLFAMSDLIAGVAAYSKASISDAANVPVDLNDLMAEIGYLTLLPPHIRIEVAKNLPFVFGNKTKVLQVFLNLISNAIKYNNKPEGLIRVSAQQGVYEVCIRIEDNGPGIAPELREKVFNLFEKGTSSRTDSQGIGLAIVHKVVQEHGGSITIQDSELGGAGFEIVWPTSPRPLTAAPSHHLAPA